MNNHLKISEKKPDASRESAFVRKPGPEPVRSTCAPLDRILYFQRTIGNQAVQRLLLSGAIPARSGIESCKHYAGVEQRIICRKADPACALSISTNDIVTEKTKDAPTSYYGASFNHKFATEPEGCSLTGMRVTEYVETIRDDFNSGQKTVNIGKNVWTLTKENKLHKPDNIWSPAGAKGLGVNPVNSWPAVMDHNQIWHFRRSDKDAWQRGPGIVIKVTLHGDRNRKDSLKVTTTDHGVSREEPYRGPNIRMRDQ